MAVGDRHQPPEARLELRRERHEGSVPVAQLHYRGAGAVPVGELVPDPLDDRGGQRGRPRAEVDDSFHLLSPQGRPRRLRLHRPSAIVIAIGVGNAAAIANFRLAASLPVLVHGPVEAHQALRSESGRMDADPLGVAAEKR